MAQNSAFTLARACSGTLAKRFLARCTRQRWRKAFGKRRSMAEMSPGEPSETTRSGQRRPLARRPERNPSQASVDSPPAPSRPTSGLALRGEPPGAEHGLGPGHLVVAEVGGVEEEHVELHRREVPDPPGVELLLDLGADPGDGGAGDPGLGSQASSSASSTSRTENPRTKDEMTRASRAFERVTPTPRSLEAKASAVPRSLGARARWARGWTGS
jgi:hypothetical protein